MNKNKLQKGFTLIETLVAVSLLMVSVVGPLVIASQGLTSAIYAKDQITAFYLAQDAVEMIRNMRDANAIAYRLDNSTDWLTGFNDCIGGKKCRISVNPTNIASPTIAECTIDGGVCPYIEYDSSTYYYGYSIAGGVTSPFRRTVEIEETEDNREAEIKVKIEWKTGTLNRNFTVTAYMLNWSQ